MRSTVEYVLSVAAQLQLDFVNRDVLRIEDSFNQLILLDPGFGGAVSLWYTTPPSLAGGEYLFKDSIKYSSFFHEMGHNFTLNNPSRYNYGGKSDGNGNAILSESIAQIFQHVTAAEIIDRGGEFGIPEDIVLDVALDAENSMRSLKSHYEAYRSSGMRFSAWNDPDTPHYETFGTFMTIGYKFFELAERQNMDYVASLKRMMSLLQTFDAESHELYDQRHDSLEGAMFRSTLMVTSLSCAFELDLRNEFRALHFPIDDYIYRRLTLKRNIAIRKKK